MLCHVTIWTIWWWAAGDGLCCFTGTMGSRQFSLSISKDVWKMIRDTKPTKQTTMTFQDRVVGLSRLHNNYTTTKEQVQQHLNYEINLFFFLFVLFCRTMESQRWAADKVVWEQVINHSEQRRRDFQVCITFHVVFSYCWALVCWQWNSSVTLTGQFECFVVWYNWSKKTVSHMTMGRQYIFNRRFSPTEHR